MKECPECSLSLPNEAHFCPRCMYEYPRAKREDETGKRRKKKRRIIIVMILFLSILTVSVIPFLSREDQMGKGPDAVENKKVIYDFRDALRSDYDSVSILFGEKTREYNMAPDFIVHEFAHAEIWTGDDRVVKGVELYYTEADEMFKEQYGIFGINGESNASDVRGMFGEPLEEYENVLWYRFSYSVIEEISLLVQFNEDGVVTELHYYTAR